MAYTSPATQSDAQAFCNLCQWVYECWTTHSNLLECLPARLEEERSVPFVDFMETPHGRCLERLNVMSHEYIILQIAKLHDPARQGRNENLSVGFFLSQDLWTEDEHAALRDIAIELEGFYAQVENARNKILAHNDRRVFKRDSPLGGFREGDDERYFRTLGQLCSMIWNKFTIRNWPYGPRTFEFAKSGIDGGSLCPSHEARELRGLIVNAFPTTDGHSLQRESEPR